MQDANSNSNNKAPVPVQTPDTSVFFLITARCNGKKAGEHCDGKITPDCISPDVCPGADIIKAEVHKCPCAGVC